MAQRLLIIAGLAAVFASGFPSPSAGHDWYMGLTNSAGVACCGSAECRPAAARYNMRTGSWETEVIKDTWLPVPPGALAPIPSPDGDYHVCEYAGTIRCFFQPGQVKRDPRNGAEHLTAFNARRGADGQAPIKMSEADQDLEDVDLIELVDVGMIPP
jgi:hypothetical protein